ncbi:P-loop NTPase fold protein [Streptomyces sp. NPDC016626]|uniref:KAP family P-loop NTPase fold protein n=1 Tax=Streptomyces sp. NPDC016626 TaxID=3364968 RepID=UPI0036FF6145
MKLWDDNPTAVDLLGFTSIVDTVVATLATPHLDPVTIGVAAPWGGGKSTVLRLLYDKLAAQDGYRVIRLDPWEFDDQFDVRGSVIGEVLQDLRSNYEEHDGVPEKINELLDRVSWSRVAMSMARGMLAAQSEDLVKNLTPRSKSDPKSMAGFRSEFTCLLKGLPQLKRLIVLVDDLDRCLPDAVMATLEAIKLFLSVEKVAFVLAADQEMVREAIAASLDGTGRGERFAHRYLEKIVQVPLSLPRIGSDEAATFITLLLSGHECPPEHYTQLVKHAQQRRAAGLSPVLADLQNLPWQPEGATLSLASQLATGLSADRSGSPRSIKRFLNAFALRSRIAESQGISIAPSVIIKLMLLEDTPGKDFETLVGLQDAQRSEFLQHWQAWARGERNDRPDRVSEASKDWAASEPDLTTAPIGPYLSLAASLVSLTAAASLTQEQITWVTHLAGEAVPHRRSAQQEITERSVAEQQAVLEALLERGRREKDTEPLVESVLHIANSSWELRARIADGLWEMRSNLSPRSVLEITDAEGDEMNSLAVRLSTATDIEAMVREAAKQALENR